MPILEALTAGVSTTGLEILATALSEAFGEGGVTIKEMGNNDLRSSVRLSGRADQVVMVILDKSSMDTCKDIENGLYASEKFYAYSDDISLVKYLNDLYGLELEIPEDQSMEVRQEVYDASVSKDIINEYIARIADRDGEITTLKYRITELQQILDDCGFAVDDEELNKVSAENLDLKSKLADLEGKKAELEETLASLQEQVKVAEMKENQLNTKLASLQANCESANRELTEEKVNSSKKSAVIKDKENEIIKLSAEIQKLTAVQSEVAEYAAEKSGYQATIDDLTQSISDLKIEIANKDAEIDRLNDQIRSNASDTKLVMEYKGYLRESESEKAALEKHVKELESQLDKIGNDLNGALDDIAALEEDLNRIHDESVSKDKDLAQLNTIKIELEGKIRLLEQSTDRNADIESSLHELDNMRKKMAELQSNVFSRISDMAFPRGSVKVNLIPLVGLHFKNIRFVFAGSTEARKGVYKSLMKEFNAAPKTNFLIVDAVSETYVDYVFQIQKITSGTDWFTSGGGVQNHLSPTILPNVKVLSNGLNFVNDSFLLTVNWLKRLEELESSGYAVVVMCGDISSLVGRVMFESFSELGATTVYALGNSVGSRTVLSNMRGMTNAKNATVVYFDFNKRMQPFYNKMAQLCKCHILNSIS